MLPACEASHGLVVILSTDLTTFWAISSTNDNTSELHSVCFPHHFVAPHHPYAITCGTVKKTMACNSASKLLRRIPTELPYYRLMENCIDKAPMHS